MREELVDMFAAQAMQALISKLPLIDRDGQFTEKMSQEELWKIKQDLCESAYAYAWFMVKAKENTSHNFTQPTENQ